LNVTRYLTNFDYKRKEIEPEKGGDQLHSNNSPNLKKLQYTMKKKLKRTLI
jgi:hypothetical protein